MLAGIKIAMFVVSFLAAHWADVEQFIKDAEALFTVPGAAATGVSKLTYVLGRLQVLYGTDAPILFADALPFLGGHIDQRVLKLFPKTAA